MKIALAYSDDFSLWIFRRGLINRLLKAGHDVYFLCTKGKYVSLLEDLGAIHIPVDVDRFIDPVKDLKLLVNLYFIFKRNKFDIVHLFTSKLNIWGALAAKLAGIKHIVISVTGLGILQPKVQKTLLRNNLLQSIIRQLYRFSCSCSSKVWFQNKDDRNFFKTNRLLLGHKDVLIRSSGVDVTYFEPTNANASIVADLRNEINVEKNSKCVVMVSRAISNKGVYEFITASKYLGAKHPNILFVLVGDNDIGNPLSIPSNYLRKNKSKNFFWLGFCEHIREIQYIADLSVLPSYYPEGVPRSLLEAMAMGNPIVTTDNVGCREVVHEGINGHIVPTKDAISLATAIEDIIFDEDKSRKYGQFSRKIIQSDFSEEIVVSRIIKELYCL